MDAVEGETESSVTSICLGLFKTHLLACSKSSEETEAVNAISHLDGLYGLPA